MRNPANQNSTTNNTQVTGISFLSLLALLFVGLKLAEVGAVATWSWWWVFAPLWGPLAILAAVLIFLALLWLIATGAGWMLSRK